LEKVEKRKLNHRNVLLKLKLVEEQNHNALMRTKLIQQQKHLKRLTREQLRLQRIANHQTVLEKAEKRKLNHRNVLLKLNLFAEQNLNALMRTKLIQQQKHLKKLTREYLRLQKSANHKIAVENVDKQKLNHQNVLLKSKLAKEPNEILQSGTSFFLANVHNPGQCLDVAGGPPDPRSPVQLCNCEYSSDSGSTDQLWHLHSQFLVNTNNNNQCLDVNGGPPERGGTRIGIYDCEFGDSGTDQKWRLVYGGQGANTVFIENVANPGLCLDVIGTPPEYCGTKIELANCEWGQANTDQLWSLRRSGD